MSVAEMKDFLVTSPKTVLRLKHDALPSWGKMTPQHMVQHLSSAIIMSLNNTTYNPEIDNQEKIIKEKKYMLINGIRPGIIIGDGKLRELRNPDLISTIIEYSNNIDNFLNAFETMTLTTSHIYFGPLTNDEWLIFHYWHIRHHLKQFALI